jgi:threonine synthase
MSETAQLKISPAPRNQTWPRVTETTVVVLTGHGLKAAERIGELLGMFLE